MSKTILIVESDAALSRTLKSQLSARGFEVDESSDGKGAPELIRRTRPDLVVLAVELSAGQNGYIICGKLKKDDELKATPIIIVGNADGFANHKKLKTRADDYLAKPINGDELIERVGAIVGFPEPAGSDVVDDESMSLGDLLGDDGNTPAEELSIESHTSEETVGGDPDLEMVDKLFDTAPVDSTDIPVDEEDLAALADLPVDESPIEEERTVVGMMPPPPPPPSAPARATAPASLTSAADPSELRQLRAKVTELELALDESRSERDRLGGQVGDLEGEVEARKAELEAVRTAGGKADNKEVFALKDSVTRKDKELLKLKTELNEKDSELIELRDKQNQLEQQMSESSGEIARRDAQIKTLTTKVDQLTAERKKIDVQLNASKEEARGSGAKLTTLQAEFDQLHQKLAGLESEAETLRAGRDELESGRARAESEVAEARGEIDALRGQADERARELEGLRLQVDQGQMDLDAAKGQLTSQATAFAEEASALRKQISELEGDGAKHEERAARLQGRLKTESELREKARRQLQTALAHLEEQGDESVDLSIDEVAEA